MHQVNRGKAFVRQQRQAALRKQSEKPFPLKFTTFTTSLAWKPLLLPAKPGLCSRASQWGASENLHAHRSAWCTFVCIPRCVGAWLCAHAKGSERGFGWGGSSPRPPAAAGGARQGQPAAPGTLPLLGGSGGKFSSSANRGLSQKCQQPLQGQVCRGAQCPFAELEGSKWLLQGACHLEASSRLSGGSAPTVPHTCLCNSETLLELFGEPW